MRAMLPALVLLAATSASVAPPSLPPDDVRELAEIQAREATQHDPENLYALAVIHERLGRWNEATALYRSYARETADGGAHSFEANAAIDRIEHAAGFIKVRADEGFDRRVWLDGRAQLATPPVTLIVPPGKHLVAGSGTAGTIQREVEVQQKQLVEVWLGPGDAPYPAPRPTGCAPCGMGRNTGESHDAALGVASTVALLALARRRRTK